MLKDFLDFNDLGLDGWERISGLAEDIYNNPDKYAGRCRDKILATLFYEPSTRTRFSTQSAMYRLGGASIGFSGTSGSSVTKGESLKDTIKMVESYADIIVIRHPRDGAAFAASLYSGVPVVNAGDGNHLHPTQTLLDLFTIGRRHKKFTGMNIGVCGDLLNGRTAHSLLRALSRYSGNNFYLISDPRFGMPEKYLAGLRDNNKISICGKITDCIGELDIIYMTRLQRERIDGKLARLPDELILNKAKMAGAKADLMVLHPLPRNEELSTDVDDDPRVLYFKQAAFGLYIRMALLLLLLEREGECPRPAAAAAGKRCANKNCILNDADDTSGLPLLANADGACAYCEHDL